MELLDAIVAGHVLELGELRVQRSEDRRRIEALEHRVTTLLTELERVGCKAFAPSSPEGEPS